MSGQDLNKNQENIPVTAENGEKQIDVVPKTPEDLGKLVQAEIAATDKEVREMKSEGDSRVGSAGKGIRLSAEEVAKIQKEYEIPEKVAELSRKAEAEEEALKEDLANKDLDDLAEMANNLELLKKIKEGKGEELSELMIAQKSHIEKTIGSEAIKKAGETENSKILKAGLDILGNMKKVEKGESPKELDVEGLSAENKQDFAKANEDIVDIKRKQRKVSENEKNKSFRCPNCGSENSSANNFCQDCTEPISEKGVFLAKARKELEEEGRENIPFADLNAKAMEIKEKEQQEISPDKEGKQEEAELGAEIGYDLREGEKGLELKIGFGDNWEKLSSGQKTKKFDTFLEKFKSDMDASFDKIPKNYQDVLLASFAHLQVVGNELRMKNGEKTKKLDLAGIDKNMAKEILDMQARLEESFHKNK